MTVLSHNLPHLPNQDWILTRHVFPPIPNRNYDYRAWVHGEDEEDRTEGSGRNPFYAVRDLYMQAEDLGLQLHCHRPGFEEDLSS